MHTIKKILSEYSDRKLYQNINLSSYIKISQKWENIMGEVLSKICYPSFYRNAVLTITVKDSVWANEIFMNRSNIFKNIKTETNIVVTELKTRIGEIKKQENINNENDINDIIEKKITKEHKEWIDKVISESHIQDEIMKEKFYNILKYEDKDD